MASPLTTWHKNHARVGDLRHHLGVVSSPTIHPMRLVSEVVCHLIDHPLDVRRHLSRLTDPHALDRYFKTPFLGNLVGKDADTIEQTLQDIPRDISQVQGEKGGFGDDIRRTRLQVHYPYRPDGSTATLHQHHLTRAQA